MRPPAGAVGWPSGATEAVEEDLQMAGSRLAWVALRRLSDRHRNVSSEPDRSVDDRAQAGPVSIEDRAGLYQSRVLLGQMTF
jgi:hypothetical protein